MVFEAIVVELLNKFLKQYVENLDTSQLKIGIWGGDVVLNDLQLKSTIFDDLNLPVRVKWGKLGKLAMKIPWKNLYTTQVVVQIEELLMIVIPNTEIVYDSEKEEKLAFEKKQAKLRAVEEAKKRDIELENSKVKDSFLEKLVTQIIKNLQIVIGKIHIRYEDKTTVPGSPFSVGVTMSNLSAATTVKDPNATFSKLLQENTDFICKVLTLEGLAIYWNSGSVLYSDLPLTELSDLLIHSIPTAASKPDNFFYIFGPMSASVFLRLNPKPEADDSNFTIPKIFLNVYLKDIELAVTHHQFSDAVAFIHDFHRISAAAKYRKYRPIGVPVLGHAREWWYFAYQAVSENIRRRKAEWSWENIKNHRNLCRRYSELFKVKLNSKKLSADQGNEITDLEKELNVFNLVLLREQVYVEVERISKDSIKKKDSKSGSWFSGWFGYGEAKTESTDDELVKKIESVLTAQEKRKLYKAIGYEEAAPPTNYPITFVELQFWFNLDEMKMTVYDDRKKQVMPVMTASVKSVKMEVEQRPSAFATKLVVIIGKFEVIGKQDKDNKFPELVTSSCKESESLIEFLYDIKPLNASCDQLINCNARPLKIIYHAETINFVKDVFTTDHPQNMESIVAATSASLPTFQKITSLGLQYAIEKRAILEVKVNIMSSCLIIPYEGVYNPEKEMLVIILGKLNIETEENPQKSVNVRQLYLKGTTDEEIFSTVLSASYTKFKCHLTGVQILFQLSGEDWVTASNIQRPSPMRFLESTNLEVIIKKSLVLDDARIPKMIIEGKLPSLGFNFSEDRFVSFIALACSIPTKVENFSSASKKGLTGSGWSIQSLGTQLETKLIHIQKEFSTTSLIPYEQGIDLVGHFELNGKYQLSQISNPLKVTELNITVSKTLVTKDKKGKDSSRSSCAEEQFLYLRGVNLGLEFTAKTFEAIYLLKLGGIEFKQFHKKTFLPCVSTKDSNGDKYLFVAEYIYVDRKIPDFYTSKGGVINRLTLNVAPLKFLLIKEALLAQIAFVTTVQSRVDAVRGYRSFGSASNASKIKDSIFEESGENLLDKKILAKGKRFRTKRFLKEAIEFFLEARMEEIDITVEFEGQGLAEFNVNGASIALSTKKTYLNVDVSVAEIFLLDLNPITYHKKIVASLEKKTLYSRVTVYNKEYFGSENAVDMSIDGEVGGLQCVFVAVFFTRVLEFLNAFQNQIKTLKEGATVAAQKAKENMMKAYHNAAQICLNIKINAPLLILPKSTVGLETIVFDLGTLHIKNSITELDSTSEGGVTGRPLIDVMILQLHDLKITRCVLSDMTVEPVSEVNLLVPVSFELVLKRNLSKAWFSVMPELEFVGRLASVHLTVTHEDLYSAKSILDENFKEGEIFTENSVTADNLRRSQKAKKKKQASVLIHSEATQILLEDVSKDRSPKFYTVVKFMFSLESFVFDALIENNSQTDTNESVGLARCVLEEISVKGRLFSDTSIHTSLMLGSCLLEDTRPGKKERLTRFMEKKDDTSGAQNAEAEANSMVEVIYHRKDNDCFIDARVYKFTLILSMDFLQKLGTFFTLEDPGLKGLEAVENVKYSTLKVDSRVSKTDILEEGRPPSFTINLRLEKPDIIVVENMDSINADALVFHTEILVKYRIAGFRQVISATLSDIELYACCFNPQRRPHTLNQVIKPFTISVAGSTPEGSGLHVDICLSEINVTVNPNTVDLITKCYEALLKDSSLSEEETQEKVYSDLWEVKSFDPDDYWFLKPDEAIEALSSLSSASGQSEEATDQICLFAIPSIKIFVEESTAVRAVPLLLMDLGFRMQCYNWSEKMTITNALTVEMQYFNKALSAWEPLIEPVECYTEQNRQYSYKPWELQCSVVYGDEGEIEDITPPKVQVTLSCTEVLQLTLTKTCMEVLKNVAETYTTAVSKHYVKKFNDSPPYVVRNETGLVAELLLDESYLQVCSEGRSDYKIVRLESNSEVELQNTPVIEYNLHERKLSISATKKKMKLFVKFPITEDAVFELPLGRSSKRYYPFPLGEFNKEELWSLVSDVLIMENTTTVVLRSILKLINDFNEPINIHSLSEDGKAAEYIGTVEGKSSFSLPFHAVYDSVKKLFFSVSGYSLSIEPFNWEDLKNELNLSVLLQCNSKQPESLDPFFIQAVGETEHIYYANTSRKTMASMIYVIHLQPTVKIVNSLPVPLTICFQGSIDEMFLQPGNTLQISTAEPGKSSVTLRISDYLEKEWSCKEKFLEHPSEFLLWKFTSYNGLAPEALNLGVHVTYKRQTAVYDIYCPYFMVNKTDHLLAYKFDNSQTVFYHPGNYDFPVMFSPTSKKFFSKKNACLQVEHSSWSEKFPVDAAGSGGTIECDDSSGNIVYKISVTVTLSSNSLTKIVVFTPFYVFLNTMDCSLEFQESESHQQQWEEIPAKSCVPFWPRAHGRKKMTVHVRPKNSKVHTPAFKYDSTDNCLLRLSDEHGGIFVVVKATQSGNYITFSAYEPGQAPALILNHSMKTIKFHENNTDFSVVLKPLQKVMHSWINPTGDRKIIVKNPKHMKDVIPLDQDGEGLVFTSKGEKVRYVTFLDGTQRILLFTDDYSISKSISSTRSNSAGIEVICKIQGVGVSFVNNLTRLEIMYMAFLSSGITWESKKAGKHRFKRMKDAEIAALEAAYEKYQDDKELTSNVSSLVEISENNLVDFEKMEVIQPTNRKLKRINEPGLWVAYRLLEDQIMLHIKINKIQIDNQVLDCVFPVVLSPVPPPKTVAATFKGPKPFFELSVVKIAADKSGVEQYKYFKVLVQEFQVKLDIVFIQKLYQFLTPEEISDEIQKKNFQKDLDFIRRHLNAYVEIVSSTEQKNFYDLLHFPPLKIRFSFSLAGNLEMESLPPAFSVMLQSLGVTLTDVNDVVFRLSYFERKAAFFTNSDLLNEVISHYYGQMVRQAYVLLLGLDVIGNPYGLIVGIGEGVEAFFYEPFQGMIQGPSEFGAGMAIGCRSLLGHTVGSAAGTLGRLTETLGKGLAVLSLDKEYQLQRMEDRNRHDNIQASMARGGRGLVMGLYEGVTGVVKKPLKGAKEEGAAGFFKGMGKGMMGLVTRPVTGVVDFASTSFNAVKRATELSGAARRMRPPRFFCDDCIVGPYNLKQAQGNSIFYSICKRKYCSTDKYEYHLSLQENEIVLLTNKRIILAELSEVFGTWQEQMAITWRSMPDKPRCHTKGVAITMPKKTDSTKKDKADVKVLLVENPTDREEICGKMVELYTVEKNYFDFQK